VPPEKHHWAAGLFQKVFNFQPGKYSIFRRFVHDCIASQQCSNEHVYAYKPWIIPGGDITDDTQWLVTDFFFHTGALRHQFFAQVFFRIFSEPFYSCPGPVDFISALLQWFTNFVWSMEASDSICVSRKEEFFGILTRRDIQVTTIHFVHFQYSEFRTRFLHRLPAFPGSILR
jgi:hypothetical protein